MKIMLINPMFTLYGGIKGHGGSSPPLNLGYLASYVREQMPGASLSFVDAEALQLSYYDIEEQIRRESPDVVGITANTPAFYHVTQITKLCKRVDPHIQVIVGGPHPSGLPEETAQIPTIDFAVVGEGEITFLELIDALGRGSGIERVRGIAYAKDRQVVRTAPRDAIANLDSLPFPARDLMPHHLYMPAPTKRVSRFKATSLCSARGCPFQCTFCGANLIWGRKYRNRSPQNVVDEIEECVKNDIREFNLTDEFFTANSARVRAICDEIFQRRLDIAFTCMSRVGTFLTADILGLMKQAGCKQISFGIESGSQSVLDTMQKQINLTDARETIERVKNAGIKTHASYMIGNIGDTETTIRHTIDFAKELNTDIAAFFVTSPLPGTALWNEAIEQGYLREGFDWIDFSPLSNQGSPVLNLPGLSSEQIKAWHRRAIKEYYLRPAYIVKRLRSMTSRVEIMNAVNGLKILFRLK